MKFSLHLVEDCNRFKVGVFISKQNDSALFKKVSEKARTVTQESGTTYCQDTDALSLDLIKNEHGYFLTMALYRDGRLFERGSFCYELQTEKIPPIIIEAFHCASMSQIITFLEKTNDLEKWEVTLHHVNAHDGQSHCSKQIPYYPAHPHKNKESLLLFVKSRQAIFSENVKKVQEYQSCPYYKISWVFVWLHYHLEKIRITLFGFHGSTYCKEFDEGRSQAKTELTQLSHQFR